MFGSAEIITDNGTGNRFNIAGWVEQSGTRNTVGVFGEGKGTGAGSNVFGGNFVGVGNNATATAVGCEVDAVTLIAGSTVHGLVIASAGTEQPQNFLQINSNGGSATRFINGIDFNGDVVSGTVILVDGLAATKFIDLSGSTFSSVAIDMGGHTIDFDVANVVSIDGATANQLQLTTPTTSAGVTNIDTGTVRIRNAETGGSTPNLQLKNTRTNGFAGQAQFIRWINENAVGAEKEQSLSGGMSTIGDGTEDGSLEANVYINGTPQPSGWSGQNAAFISSTDNIWGLGTSTLRWGAGHISNLVAYEGLTLTDTGSASFNIQSSEDPAVIGRKGAILWKFFNSANTLTQWANFDVRVLSATDGSEDTVVSFSVFDDGVPVELINYNSNTTEWVFDNTNIRIGAGFKLSVDSDGTEAGFFDLGHTADPSSATGGDMYYNTTDNIYKFYNGTIWKSMESSIGLHDVWVGATGMWESTTGGCAILAKTELATDQDIQTLDFDGAAIEAAQFEVPLPKNWNGGTITVTFHWSAAGTQTTDVDWRISGVSIGDNQVLTTAYGTAITVTDAHNGTAQDLNISADTAAVTIAGAGKGEFLRFLVERVGSADTMTQDARLHGVYLHFTIDATTAA